MSGAPVKRSHEEGGHSSSLKFPPNEDSGSYPKLTSTICKMGPDARLAKIPRSESRDVHRRSPLHSIYRMPPSSNESHMDSHLNLAPETRLESRDSTGSRDYRIENHDARTDAGETNGEARRDSRSVKNERDVRLESRGDDNKEVKHDREAHLEPKNDVKIGKDDFGPAIIQVNWKEPKEYQMGKRYLESAGGHVDPWHISRGNSQGPVEIGKEVVSIEERDRAEAHEVVGENKAESKGEDKFKDKDRKRKDLKHREWGDKDKERSDRRGSMQVGNSSAEGKESVKEEREGERWEQERKDLSKDRDTLKEREKDRMKRESGTGAGKDGSIRISVQDSEGCQGKSEVSSVIYKVSECMQELIKLWEEYEASQSDKNSESSHKGPTLEIRIPAEHITATNRQVRGGQLWGTDIYTNDSDLVAVLMHTGYFRPTASPPPPAIQELHATIRVLPPQDSYTSMLRNNVRSRAWGAGIGCSYRVERCCIVKKVGGIIDLEPCLTHTSAAEPTLAPVAVERAMTTRAPASNALRQQRFLREVTIQYNLCNEPWIKYSISIVSDKGLKKPLYTSARLKKGEVLYLETHSCRYELCFTGEKMVKVTRSSQVHEDTDKFHNHHPHSSNGEKHDSDNVHIDVFRWSRCKKPLPQKVMQSVGIPLPLEHVQVLEENLDWEDVQWSQTGVWIAGKEFTLARVRFLSPS